MLFAFSLLLSLSAQAFEFNSEVCSDLGAVTKEVIELEVAGTRWQGGTSTCLKQSQFKTTLAIPQKISDSSLLDPEYILTKGREIRITSEKWLDIGAVEVKFAYIGKKDGKDIPVQDRLVYSVNYGKKRSAQGCASLIEVPEHFVMRAECVKD